MSDGLRGFGMTFDLVSGGMRRWYIDREGVKRWADNDDAVSDRQDESLPQRQAEGEG